VSIDERLAAEREMLRTLSVPELEALAAESQALVDKALAMARGKHAKPAIPISADRRVNEGEGAEEPADKRADPARRLTASASVRLEAESAADGTSP
jgi:hypothetical protein